MSTVVSLKKRLIGASDINWDAANKGETFQPDGMTFALSKVNSSHIPIGPEGNGYLDGKTVSNCLINHEKRVRLIEGVSSSLDADTTIEFDAGETSKTAQQKIDSIPKNLGGHTLTIVPYTENFYGVFELSRFSNGSIIVRGYDGAAFKATDTSNCLVLYSCTANITLRNLTFDFVATAVEVTSCVDVRVDNCTFTGADITSSLAFEIFSSGLRFQSDAQGNYNSSFVTCKVASVHDDGTAILIDERTKGKFVTVGSDGKIDAELIPVSKSTVMTVTSSTLTIKPSEIYNWIPTELTCVLSLLSWDDSSEQFADFIIDLPEGGTLVSTDCTIVDDLTSGVRNHCVVRSFNGEFRLFVVDIIEEVSAS